VAECYEYCSLTTSNILGKIKDNPQALKDPAVLEGLAKLKIKSIQLSMIF